jgi:hypothetical protein
MYLKIDRVANIQKSLLALRKMSKSTVKMVVCTTSSHQSSFLHYFKQHLNEGCCHWLSFVIELEHHNSMVHGQHDFHFCEAYDVTGIKITRNSNSKVCRFPFTIGNIIFLVATDPVCHFHSFQHYKSTLLHQGRLLRKKIIKKEPNLMEKSLRQS